jgi:hypothetical protein
MRDVGELLSPPRARPIGILNEGRPEVRPSSWTSIGNLDWRMLAARQ